MGALYGASVAFKARHARPYDPQLPVICVGNLTAGGSGKTPIAIAIAEILRAKGHRPYFLTRGYGGSTSGPALASRGHSAAAILRAMRRGCWAIRPWRRRPAMRRRAVRLVCPAR